MEYVTLISSFIALTISFLTFWLTRIRGGVVKMTRPTVIFFGPDGVGSQHNKIFIRTLLYSTSEKGKYVQNMFIRLQRGESVQNFNIWVYDNNGLVRGSGLFINKNGFASNHHFLIPKDGTKYIFTEGEYLIQVFVETVDENPRMIFKQKLFLNNNQQEEMENKGAGIYFDWAPNTQNYYSHVDTGPKSSPK
jgi:hypothetical protein